MTGTRRVLPLVRRHAEDAAFFWMRLNTALQADCAVADLHFHASGATGEEWCLREATLALSRAMERRRDEFPHHAISHYLGETGVAAPLLTLAWLSEAMPRARSGPGRLGLAHFAGDDGQRSALVLRHMA